MLRIIMVHWVYSCRRSFLTCIEERRNGYTSNQVFKKQALSSNQDSYEGCQRVMKGQITNLR